MFLEVTIHEEKIQKGTWKQEQSEANFSLNYQKEVLALPDFGSGAKGFLFGVTISMPLGRIFIHCFGLYSLILAGWGFYFAIPLFVDWFFHNRDLLLFTHPHFGLFPCRL